LRRGNFDVVIPVQRKGTALWRIAAPDIKSSIFWDSEYLTDSAVRNKKVLILDDVTMTGEAFSRVISIVRKYSPKEINTAAYIVSRRSPLKPNFYCLELNENELFLHVERLQKRYAALGEPLETDNLLIRTNVSPSLRPLALKSLIRDLGDCYERELDGPHAFWLTLIPTKTIPTRRHLGIIAERDFYKVRFYFRAPNFTIVPVAFPKVEFTSTQLEKSVRRTTVVSKFGPIDRSVPASRILYDLVRVQQQIALAKWITKILQFRFKRERIVMKVVGVEWRVMTSRYPAFSSYLKKTFASDLL
jgi:hypothetical protein